MVLIINHHFQPYLLKQIISRIDVRKSHLRFPVSPELQLLCPGQMIIAIQRRAKYLILQLTHGYILIHLGMSGHLRIDRNNILPGKHDHIDLHLANDVMIRYTDPRRFGFWLYFQQDPNTYKLLSHLGPEPLSPDFNAAYLFSRSRNKKQSIKAFLMDNHVVVGVGNIYATESLFMAKTHPQQPAGSLTLNQFTELVYFVKEILQKAIQLGGTTLKDFYSVQGKPGYFINQLQMYGRKNQPCLRCEHPIEVIRIAGRSSTFCSNCQPLNF